MERTAAEKELKRITTKIVREFDPEKIILFGSLVWGKPGPDSDIDLLVVKNSKKPRREREAEIDRALSPRRLALDLLVYTPAELEERIRADRNLFLEDIVQNGVVLYARHQVRR